MATFAWKDSIKFAITSLELVGLWPKNEESYHLNLYTCYAVFIQIFFVGAHNFVQILNIVFMLDDFTALTGTIYVTLTCAGAMLKSYSLMQNMKDLKQIFFCMNNKVFQPKNLNQKLFIEDNMYIWKRMHRFMYCVGLVCAIFWLTFPILEKSYNDNRLPFLAWYPYDLQKSFLYVTTYLHQGISVCIIIIININIDMLIVALNVIIGIHCDLLCDNLEQLDNNKKALQNCFIYHQKIIRFAKSSNSFFNWIVLFQFFTSGISLGFGMFQLTIVVPFTPQFYSFTLYCIAIFVEIFFYCWYGNEVEIKSHNILRALFKSKWTQFDKEAKTSLIIFSINVEKPIKMSALNIFFLSVNTFIMILRTSWSYFTVLSRATA